MELFLCVLCFDIKTVSKKVKLATVVEGDQKAPFSIATTPKCREGRYSYAKLSHLK